MLFQFADLVNKYSVPCTLAVIGKGAYKGGEYQQGERMDMEITAAVISMSQQKIFESGGTLTSADRTMYILKEKDVIDLEGGGTCYIIHHGKSYKVEAAGLYGEDYADFNEYTLRRVDSFME